MDDVLWFQSSNIFISYFHTSSSNLFKPQQLYNWTSSFSSFFHSSSLLPSCFLLFCLIFSQSLMLSYCTLPSFLLPSFSCFLSRNFSLLFSSLTTLCFVRCVLCRYGLTAIACLSCKASLQDVFQCVLVRLHSYLRSKFWTFIHRYIHVASGMDERIILYRLKHRSNCRSIRWHMCFPPFGRTVFSLPCPSLLSNPSCDISCSLSFPLVLILSHLFISWSFLSPLDNYSGCHSMPGKQERFTS